MDTEPGFITRLATPMRAWGARPAALCCLLLALSAIAQPYVGMRHDAMLYSGQVLLHANPKTYQDDLYFRHGSQDRFSVFAPVLAPLAKGLGIDAAFFLVYVASVMAWLLASQRLLLRLFPAEAAVPALVFLAVAPASYGGMGTFHVWEPFVTPRLPACALSLWGFERVLSGRPLTGIVCFLAGMALHPLMTAPALAAAFAYALWKVGELRLVVYVGVASLGGLAWLYSSDIASSWLGTYDDVWRRLAEMATPNLFPPLWSTVDWTRIAVQTTLVAAAAFLSRRDALPTCRLLGSFVLIGMGGAVLNVAACSFSYALPIMAQPYRALWLVSWAVPAAAFSLIGRGLASPRAIPPFLGLALFFIAGLVDFESIEALLPLLMFAPIGFLFWIRNQSQPVSERLVSAACLAIVTGLAIWSGFKAALIVRSWNDLAETVNGIEGISMVMRNVSPLVFVAAVWGFAPLLRWRGFAPALATVGAVGLVACFAVPWLPAYRERATPHGADLAFARQTIDANREERPITVYSNLGRLNYVWLDLGARSYFDWFQTAGVLFNRGTAVEALSRAEVVGPFEMARLKKHWHEFSPIEQTSRRDFLQMGADREPDLKALERLAKDETVDWIILYGISFPGHVVATNGRVFLYDARAIREALR